MSLARAYEAAVREAAGWLPRTRVWQASLALPEPPPLRYRVRVRGVRRVCESRQSAWPRICLRCGTPGGQSSLPLGVSTTAGDQLVLVATLPATRAYLQALAQELQRLGCPVAFSVRPVEDTDGRGENRRIRAAKPWRNLRWLDCGGCTQAAAYLISRRSDLAFARVAGGVYVCRRWVPLEELTPDEWPAWRPDWVPDRPIPSTDPPPKEETVLWRLPGPQDEKWQISDGADVPQGAVWLRRMSGKSVTGPTCPKAWRAEMKMGMLPTGQRWDGSEAQMHRIWCIWYQVTMIAINRGLGVAVEPAPDGVVEITTIGAPQWEEIRIAVHPDGALTHCSEQCAPDIDGPWVSPRADDREALLGAAQRPSSFGLRDYEADIILHVLADWRQEEVKAIADRIRRVAAGDHVDVLTDEQRAIRWTRGEAAA